MKQQETTGLEGQKSGSESKMSSDNSPSEFTGDDYDYDFDLDMDDYLAEIGTITNRKHIKEQVQKLIKKSQDTRVVMKLKHERDKVQAKINRQRQRIERLMHSAPFWRLADKLGFVLGTLIIFSFSFILGKYPNDFFYIYYFFITLVMLIIRYAHYYSCGWHYFIADFCYFGNFLTLYLIMYN
jgi:Protein of unknown function (DUF2838)